MSPFAGKYASDFENLIRIEGLDNLDDLMRSSLFEEVPLFSRYAHISFLDRERVEDRSAILIRAALSYLPVIVDHSEKYYRGRPYDYYCVVSVLNWEPIDDITEPIQPCFWYTNPSIGVLDHINLVPAYNEEGLFTRSILADSELYDICHNDLTPQTNDAVKRIYIQPKKAHRGQDPQQ